MTDLSGPLLPADLLQPSPSRADGVDPTEELMHRAFGCELIQEAGILLRLPQVVMVTGQNLLHRFFYRKSLKRFDVCTVAMGCLLLATKIEEKPKILREIIYAFHRMYQRRCQFRITVLELGGEQYNTWKNDLMTIERYILKDLGFAFYNIGDHPHKYILYFIKVVEGDSELAQCAWNYLNDSMRLDLCLRHRAEAIACAAVYMAVQTRRFPLPAGVAWWEPLGAGLRTVVAIASEIVELYAMPKLTWLHPLGDDSLFSPEECLKFDTPLGGTPVMVASATEHNATESALDTRAASVDASVSVSPERKVSRGPARSRSRSPSSSRRRRRSGRSSERSGEGRPRDDRRRDRSRDRSWDDRRGDRRRYSDRSRSRDSHRKRKY